MVEYSGSRCLKHRRSQVPAELSKLGKCWFTFSSSALLTVEGKAAEGIPGSLLILTVLNLYRTKCWIRAMLVHTWWHKCLFDLSASRAEFPWPWRGGEMGSRSDPVFVKGQLKRKHLCQALRDRQVGYYLKYTGEVRRSQSICHQTEHFWKLYLQRHQREKSIFCLFFTCWCNFWDNKIILEIPTEPNLIFKMICRLVS